MNNEVYQRAERFFPWNLQHSVFNSTIFPYWSSEALYYFQQSDMGKILIRVSLLTGKKESILNFQELIIALSIELKQEVDSEKLPLDGFSVKENPKQVCFSYQKNNWCYDVANKICVSENTNRAEFLKSPDGNWTLSTKNYNLLLSDLQNYQDFHLTTDGQS